MKILVFHQFFLGKNDPGGSRWNQFVKYFSKKHQLTVLAGNVHYATGKRIGRNFFYTRERISDKVMLHRTWTYSGYNSNFFGRLIGYLSFTISSFVTALFLSKPDIIIISSPPLFIGLSALLIAKVKRIPLIFEVRDLWPESAIATGVTANKILIFIMYKIEKTLYNNAAAIVALTPAFKKNIGNRFPKLLPKIHVITNGADFDLMAGTSDPSGVRKKHGWGDRKVFSYFGAHGLANDLQQILHVAELFKNNPNILFVLIGDGMLKNQLIKQADELQLSNVQFIDSVPKEQVQNYIHASDVCMAILKKTDTFKTVYPNKVFDYMSCRKPVIVTIDGITRKLIADAGCGLYAEPGNTEAFKRSVHILSSMPENKLRELGDNGFKFVSDHFDRNKLADNYLQLIETVAKNV